VRRDDENDRCDSLGWIESGSSEEQVDDTSDSAPNAGTGQEAYPGDVSVLRSALDAANERLALYEGFDRLIEDQVRRAGETVREVVALRDEAAHAKARHGLESELEAIAAEVQSLALALESLGQRVDRLRSSLGAGDPAPHPVSTSKPVDHPAGDTAPGPGAIDLIVHQVPDTATAVSLQRFVSELGPVAGVDVREFAEGVLRLHLTVNGPLDAAMLASWDHSHRMQPLHQTPTLVELTIEPGN
jgi:hypothetical protein